jgi:hypothetical protein
MSNICLFFDLLERCHDGFDICDRLRRPQVVHAHPHRPHGLDPSFHC